MARNAVAIRIAPQSEQHALSGTVGSRDLGRGFAAELFRKCVCQTKRVAAKDIALTSNYCPFLIAVPKTSKWPPRNKEPAPMKALAGNSPWKYVLYTLLNVS